MHTLFFCLRSSCRADSCWFVLMGSAQVPGAVARGLWHESSVLPRAWAHHCFGTRVLQAERTSLSAAFLKFLCNCRENKNKSSATGNCWLFLLVSLWWKVSLSTKGIKNSVSSEWRVWDTEKQNRKRNQWKFLNKTNPERSESVTGDSKQINKQTH